MHHEQRCNCKLSLFISVAVSTNPSALEQQQLHVQDRRLFSVQLNMLTAVYTVAPMQDCLTSRLPLTRQHSPLQEPLGFGPPQSGQSVPWPSLVL